MKTRRFALASLALASFLPHAWAFSGPGHQFVGALAEQILTQRAATDPKAAKALARARALLGGMSFATAATIPDDLKQADPGQKYATDFAGLATKLGWPQAITDELKAYLAANGKDPANPNKYHHNYHFADIAIAPGAGLHYTDGMSGTNQYDIVHTLRFCEKKVTGDPADDGRAITPAVALVLLTHLVGDLHQPLHVGAEYFLPSGELAIPTLKQLSDHSILGDVGGNNLTVDATISKPNQYGPGELHATWDFDIPDRVFKAWKTKYHAHSQKPEVLAQAMVDANDYGTFPELSGSAPWENWASEVLPLAQQAHGEFQVPFTSKMKPDATTFTGDAVLVKTGEDYDGWAEPAMETQLTRAGVRLAWVIEETLGN